MFAPAPQPGGEPTRAPPGSMTAWPQGRGGQVIISQRTSAGLSEHTAAEDRVHAPAAGTAAAAVAAGELDAVL
ncbi:hypothetical protein OJAV_G00007440 [Oryzias javanicus]|uniref:Uncharacterized protein n=1 Tax=Oryzias javanicus TaxID=123683 RepID=A0A3S2PI35_ORYJA|nr:hypothetical protein OJAV_G00007440 [Oryzias javanicus]